MPGMDARAVAEAADLGVNTLNVWVARGLVPGMSIGTRGLRRDFDLETGTAVIVMAELTRFGISAFMASEIAKEVGKRSAKRMLITKPPAPSKKMKNYVRAAFFDGDDEISQTLGELRDLAQKRREPRPSVSVLLDLEILAAKMQAAHQKWERQRARGATADDQHFRYGGRGRACRGRARRRDLRLHTEDDA